MNLWRIYSIALVTGLAVAGCNQPSSPTPSPTAASIAQTVQPSSPTKAQPRLQTTKLYLGSLELTTELALTGLQQQTGMMWRTNMPEMEAMIFVFPYAHQAAFWMMNTIVPLSAAYVDPDGTILEIHDLQPHDTNSVAATSNQIQYVLEVNQGWFQRNKIGVGTVLRTEQGTLRETFFRRR